MKHKTYHENLKKKVSSYKLHLSILFGLILVSFSVWSQAHAATLYAGSAYQVVSEGQTFVVEWLLDTEGQSANLVSLKLDFTPETLEAVEAATGNSQLSLLIKPPEILNEQGSINLIGGIPGGVMGTELPILQTVFRAKAAGRARISMDPASSLLSHDGSGATLPLRFQELDLVIVPKTFRTLVISSPSHSQQEKWYQDNRVIIKVGPQPGKEYSYSFSSNLDIIPDERADEVPPEVIFENLPDGIYYFKLNSRPSGDPPKGDKIGWEEAEVFRVQIDTTPPEEFTPLLASDPAIFEGEPFLSFQTVDKTSGILHYKVKVGLVRGAAETPTPYKLTRPLLDDTIEVLAIDRAGNIRKVIITYEARLSKQVLVIIIILLVIIASGLIIFRKKIWESKLQ